MKISLDQLRSPAIALEWHEAVAVTAALASLVTASEATVCPHPTTVLLTQSGEILSSGSAQMLGGAARGLADVLEQLLAGRPCPAALRQLADQLARDADSTGHEPAAVERLLSQLMFFERPDRTAVLAALASRAEAALERPGMNVALEASTDPTRQDATMAVQEFERFRPARPEHGPSARAMATAPNASPVTSQTTVPPPRNLHIVPVIVAATVFLSTAYGVASWFAPAPSSAPVAAEGFSEDEPGAGSTEAVPPARAPSAAGRRPPSPSRPSTPASAESPRPPSGSAAAPASPPPPSKSGPQRVDVSVAEGAGRALPPPKPVAARIAKGPVYTAADAAVLPAVLIRPRMADRPPMDVPDEQIGTLEFIVDESGTVEQVRLLSPANRYHERMLVAAAKNWQFQPATREGRPVRFQTRIRLLL